MVLLLRNYDPLVVSIFIIYLQIFDFGLAREVRECDKLQGHDTYIMSGETGTLRYMAPEVAQGLPYNHKIDVYAFGKFFSIV